MPKPIKLSDLPTQQARMLRMLRRRPASRTYNLAQGTALLRTARALECRGLVCIIRNSYCGGFDVSAYA